MKIAIVGYARDGQAAYEYWNRDSNELTICDQNEDLQLPEDASRQLGSDYLKNLDQFDVIVRTAGIPPILIAEANPGSPDVLKKVTGNIDEFFRASPTRNIIGVTGTKGKGTTSTLIAKLLEAVGHRVHIGGNIGVPALELLKANILPDDWIVLEQSSFQLIDQQHSPHIAVCLMVEPEHLNWHKDIEEYVRAKQNIFAYQLPGDIAVYNLSSPLSRQVAVTIQSKVTVRGYAGVNGEPADSEAFCEVRGDSIVANGTTVARVGDVSLIGRHNLENVCAAVAATWDIIKNHLDVVPKVLKDFMGLPHRLEFVREVNGVKYYNDSFATGPPASIAALASFAGPKVMIFGGFDRQLELESLAAAVSKEAPSIRKILLIGESAERLAKALSDQNFTNYEIVSSSNIKEIVEQSKSVATSGDSVVFSPGFASFDMFKDFEDRGLQFKSAVVALA